jgi:hypothetical protein
MADVYRQYSRSSLVDDLHGFPHYDASFHVVSENNTYGAGLDYSNKEYIESLAMWTAAALVASAVVLLGGFVLMCCVCGSTPSSYERMRKPRHRCCLSFCSVCIILAAITVIALNAFLDKSINSAEDDIKSIQNVYDTAVGLGVQTSSYFANVSTWILQIDAPDGQCKDGLNDISSMFGSMSTAVASVVADAPVLDLDDVHYSELKKLNHGRSIGTYVFEAVLLLTALLLMTRCCRAASRGLISILVGVVLFLLLLVYIFFGAQLSAAVGAADMCYQPTAFAEANIDSVLNLDYYLNCDGNTESPYAHDFETADAKLASANTALPELQAKCNSTIAAKDYARLGVSINNSVAFLLELEHTVDCQQTHNLYVDILDKLCGDGLQRVIVMDGLTALQVVCMSICLFAVIYLFQHTRSSRSGYYELDGELTPLVRTSGNTNGPPSKASSLSPPITTCKVCNTRLIAVLLLPCRHTVCRECSMEYYACPWCRTTIHDRQAVSYRTQ